VGVAGGLVQEEVLDDDALHRRQALGHVAGVRIGLDEVLALDVEALEGAVDGGVEHVRDAEAGLALEANGPGLFEDGADGEVGDVAVAGELVRDGAG
jgi:hypothetical protein